jgi:hypothetical protein
MLLKAITCEDLSQNVFSRVLVNVLVGEVLVLRTWDKCPHLLKKKKIPYRAKYANSSICEDLCPSFAVPSASCNSQM